MEFQAEFRFEKRLVFQVKVFSDSRPNLKYKSDFQNEILALLPPKSAKTFHESLQILSPRKSRGKSLQTLVVITPESRKKVRI